MAQGHTKKDFLQANKRHRFLYLNPWNCPGTNHRQSKTLNSGNHSVLPLQLHVSTQCQRGIITTSQKYRGNHLSQLRMHVSCRCSKKIRTAFKMLDNNSTILQCMCYTTVCTLMANRGERQRGYYEMYTIKDHFQQEQQEWQQIR
jgi:hypothetical protein